VIDQQWNLLKICGNAPKLEVIPSFKWRTTCEEQHDGELLNHIQFGGVG
jgi:hypothetical protein